MNGQAVEVRLCSSPDCSLYHFRLGRKGKASKTTSCKAIKARCKDCMPNQRVRNCQDKDCFLYPYRLGKNPNIKRPNASSNFNVIEIKSLYTGRFRDENDKKVNK